MKVSHPLFINGNVFAYVKVITLRLLKIRCQNVLLDKNMDKIMHIRCSKLPQKRHLSLVVSIKTVREKNRS